MAVRPGDEMARARKVVGKVMQHHGAKLLFNKPVPLDLFPDYASVVPARQRMDLGTIRAKLDSSAYCGVAALLADVRKVWAACLKYNSGPADAGTRDLCEEVKSEFERLWTLEFKQQESAGAKRGGIVQVAEADVPGKLSTQSGGCSYCKLCCYSSGSTFSRHLR
jgi:hypothetical protein